ncbi:hypothetical protein D3C71_1638260 [compost metagenome]
MIGCKSEIDEFIRIDDHAHIQISPVHGILENVVIRIQEEIVDQAYFLKSGNGVLAAFLLDFKSVIHPKNNPSGRFR